MCSCCETAQPGVSSGQCPAGRRWKSTCPPDTTPVRHRCKMRQGHCADLSRNAIGLAMPTPTGARGTSAGGRGGATKETARLRAQKLPGKSSCAWRAGAAAAARTVTPACLWTWCFFMRRCGSPFIAASHKLGPPTGSSLPATCTSAACCPPLKKPIPTSANATATPAVAVATTAAAGVAPLRAIVPPRTPLAFRSMHHVLVTSPW
jgi:hypothetical protein